MGKMSKLDLYASSFYSHQLDRCTNPKNVSYKFYGLRGIAVEYSREEFIQWFKKNASADMRGNLSIGRIDHNKNYSLDNIEIQTRSENSKERQVRCGPSMPRQSVLMYDRETGEVIKKFSSILEASKTTGVRIGTISRWLDRAPKNTKHNDKYSFFFVRDDA